MKNAKKGAMTTVPTECLIEDYQTLMQALRALDDGNIADARELIGVAMDCIACDVSSNTDTSKSELTFTPSVASLIAMSMESGIIAKANGEDVRCAAGKGISEAYDCETCQCDHACMVANGCYPEQGVYALSGGYKYDITSKSRDEALIAHLKEEAL